VSFTQKLPEMCTRYILHHLEADNLYCDLLSRYSPKRSCELAPGIFALGAPQKRELNEEEFLAVAEFFQCAPHTVNVTSFVWRTINGFYIYGLDYKCLTRRNCSTIKYFDGKGYSFAQVKCFIQIADFFENVLDLALCYPLYCESYDNSTHINVVSQTYRTRLISVDIKNFSSNCIFISLKMILAGLMCASFPTNWRPTKVDKSF